jgi:hypothetical protein
MRLHEIVEEDLPIVYDLVKTRVDRGEPVYLLDKTSGSGGVILSMHTTTTSVIFEFRQIRDTTGGPGLMMRIHPDEFNKALFFKRKSDGIWQLTLPAVEDMNEEVEEEDPDEPMVVAIVNANLAKKKHVRFIDLSTGEVGFFMEPLKLTPFGYRTRYSAHRSAPANKQTYKMDIQKSVIDGAKLVKRELDGMIELQLHDFNDIR